MRTYANATGLQTLQGAGNKAQSQGTLALQADGVGFEPTEGYPSAVFKTAAFNHSATHPYTHKVLRAL